MYSVLGNSKSPTVIAELGAKYAPMDVMVEMVRSAAKCGADIVKFQTFRADTLAVPGSTFKLDSGKEVSQYEFFKSYELTREDHEVLISACRDSKVGWLSTPSHPTDVDLLETFQPVAYKTGSDDLTNLPFLKYIAQTGRPMIISTGMSTLSEIEMAVDTVTRNGVTDIVLLHCVVSYPAKAEDANIRALEVLRKAFGVPVGLSDHTKDEFTSILAVQAGACVIEKHFTIDHSLNLPDDAASLDPAAFKILVDRVRLVEKALGTGQKVIMPTEQEWRKAARKSIFSKAEIAMGQTIAETDLCIRRPSCGISPSQMDLVVGRKATRSIAPQTLLTWDML